jgi:uncharacterized HAD superfamily protein
VNLGFDVDGVIADFVTGFAKVVKRNHGMILREKDVCYHDLGLVLGISKEEKNTMIRETLLEDLPQIAGARDGLNRLYDEGHRIIIMTARPRDSVKTTMEWLKSNSVSYSKLIFLDHDRGSLDAVDFDIVVEDNLENAIEWSEKAKKVLLYDHPWNRSINIERLFIRVYNWNDILKEIKLGFGN